ncbi:MAG TPA: signal recognition particle-docking protein FtsY [Methanomicrobiales archaeon]|nr:signal recognition particle-docking protein FtsY [Methanomicrobiales archaeon]
MEPSEAKEEPEVEEPPEKEEPFTAQDEAEERKTGFRTKVKAFVKGREFVLDEKDIEEPLMDLEIALLENDVALPTVEAILDHLKGDLIGAHRRIRESPDAIVTEALKNALLTVLGDGLNIETYIDSHQKPVKILFTGVNGTGKTTTVAKVGDYLKRRGFSVVIGSGDTFRAGALDQLAIHAERVGIKVIQHKQGADPSAVLYDAVQYATAHKIDVVLADTAGRFHNRANLMNQLDKIKRVMKPDLIVYVDEAVAGNDAVVRAEEFNSWVGTDAVVLTKADIDPKGGAAISITHTIGKPIIFLGTGQGYDDIVPFSPKTLVEDLLGGET